MRNNQFAFGARLAPISGMLLNSAHAWSEAFKAENPALFGFSPENAFQRLPAKGHGEGGSDSHLRDYALAWAADFEADNPKLFKESHHLA
ncbi:MAG: hypothetical protein LBF40_01675 [Deltaproteobacteria bacterium]|nr:hypothetical protein [Deltaproteobacteria bacterium]